MDADEYDKRIAVQISDNCGRFGANIPQLDELVRTVCARFGVENVTVSIAIVDNAEIKNVNKNFLERDCVTDVISFDLSDNSDQGTMLFDIVVNGEVAVEQALKRRIKPAAELALYVTHGLLHNMGFNDSTAGQAAKMHSAEDEILKQLGYGLVYNS